MIVLISFSELETSLFGKVAVEAGIAHHVRYIPDATGNDIDAFHATLAHAEKAYPKVLVLNLDHPSGNWRDVLGTLKANPSWRKIPVLGFSFLEEPGIVEEFYALRGASLIRKPNNFEELRTITKTAMKYWLSVATLPNEYLTQY